MINLYGKIFIGFWLSMIAIIGSWLLAGHYVDNYPEPQLPQEPLTHRSELREPPPGALPPRHMFRIYYAMQNLEAEELPAWIRNQEKQHDIRILLLDENRQEVFQRERVKGTDEVIDKLGRFRRRANLRSEDVSLFAQRLHRPELGAVTMVVASYPPASPLIKLLTEHLWLRLLLAVIISGLISYLVSRYLTRPLKELQQASRHLAEGNLDTRIEVASSGGDETAELARDFNTMASQLQQRIQEQKRLLHDVSHELRSPLARLRVAIALAEREPDNSAAHLQRMERETERLEELIAQLLVVPGARIPLDDSLDLVGLLKELVDDANFEARGSDKSVVLLTSLGEAVVKTHSDLLKKALENVIRNALHYTAVDTRVEVTVTGSPGQYQITVDDHGPGIPAEELERIFEPFYRVDEARQRDTGGFGLGLAISKRAVAQHNGQIDASNTGSGLRISIDLPA